MAEAPWTFPFDETCWQCGGEGRINAGCIDYCCVDQDDPNCPYCSRRCDVCGGKGGFDHDDDTLPRTSLPGGGHG